MSEYSMPWADGAGDGGPYSSESWDDLFEVLFTTDQAATEGVIAGRGGELEVTGTASPASVATGAAVVKGKIYINTAAVDVSVPTPTGDTRYDRIVLQADYSARTVRIARLEGSEGGSAPSLTQTDGTKWEIPLAQLEVHTDGSIVVTDQRAFAHFGTRISASQVEDGPGSGLDADTLQTHAPSTSPSAGDVPVVDSDGKIHATATEADHAASADEADHATNADHATDADHATNSDELGGHAPSYFVPAGCSGCITKGMLKVGAGYTSITTAAGAQYNVTLNDFSFTPNVVTLDTGGDDDKNAYDIKIYADRSDHADYVARFAVANQTADRSFAVRIRWRYVTASRPPETMVVLDEHGRVIAVWVSEIERLDVWPVETGDDRHRLVQVLTLHDLRGVDAAEVAHWRLRPAHRRDVEHLKHVLSPAMILHPLVADVVTIADEIDRPLLVG